MRGGWRRPVGPDPRPRVNRLRPVPSSSPGSPRWSGSASIPPPSSRHSRARRLPRRPPESRSRQCRARAVRGCRRTGYGRCAPRSPRASGPAASMMSPVVEIMPRREVPFPARSMTSTPRSLVTAGSRPVDRVTPPHTPVPISHRIGRDRNCPQVVQAARASKPVAFGVAAAR